MPPTTPTISRYLSDGTLIELLADPERRTSALVVAAPGRAIVVLPEFTLPSGERLTPYSATNNLLTSGCVLLPSAVGDFRDKETLLGQVRSFLHRYVDLSPLFEEIAAHYVLLTWVYDAFSDLGYLRLRGDFGTGKTRGILTIGSLCHKPFFASGASSVSPIFHIQDAFQGTLVLDEADFRFTDATAELTKVLNNGTTAGLPVLRTMSNRNRELSPTAFRVFGPKLVGMRERFSDAALESRFLSEETGGRPLRTDVPIYLPPSFKAEAQALRNDLLAWRFAARRGITALPARLPRALSPRRQQTTLALLSLVDDEGLRSAIVEHLAFDEQRSRSGSWETLLVTALAEAFARSTTGHAPVKEVAARFNQLAEEELGKAMSYRWIGGALRGRLRITTHKSNGVYVVPATERPRAEALVKRHGLGDIPSFFNNGGQP